MEKNQVADMLIADVVMLGDKLQKRIDELEKLIADGDKSKDVEAELAAKYEEMAKLTLGLTSGVSNSVH